MYDGLVLCLLMAAPAVGIFLFGAVRLWSFGPLMFCTFLGVALFLARPFFNAELRSVAVPPGGVAWLVLLGYSACLIPASAVPYESRIEWLRMASYVGAYWAWTGLMSKHKRWRYMLFAMIILATVTGWYALVQYAHGSRMVLGLERPAVYGMRASGTYMCPNHFANLLGILLCLSVALLFLSNAGVPLRLVAGYGAVIFVPALVLTQSRSGWVGAVVGVTVTIGVVTWRRSRKTFFRALGVIAVLLVSGVLAAWHFSPVARERIEGMSLSSPDNAVHSRLLTWKDTARMIKDRPVFGHGPGTYRWTHSRYRTHQMQLWFRYAHNEYLHVTAEYGVVGLLLFAAVLGAGALGFVRACGPAAREKDVCLVAAVLGGASACLTHAFFDFNFHLFANVHVLLLIAGTAAAGLYASDCLKARPVLSKRGLIVWGATAGIAMVLGLLSVQATVAYLLDRRGDAHWNRLRADEALRAYQRAIATDPGYWEPYLGVADIRMAQGFFNFDKEEAERQALEAIAFYEQSRERNPWELDALHGKSRALATLGKQEEALAVLREVVASSPNDADYLVQLGLQLRFMERHDEALAVFRQAAQLRPGDETVKLNLKLLRRKLQVGAEKKPQ